MTALEREFELLSPAADGGEERLGTVRVSIGRGAVGESSQGGIVRGVQKAVALVGEGGAPERGFSRGMILRSGGERWRIKEAQAHRRVWVLCLERAIMDGEV